MHSQRAKRIPQSLSAETAAFITCRQTLLRDFEVVIFVLEVVLGSSDKLPNNAAKHGAAILLQMAQAKGLIAAHSVLQGNMIIRFMSCMDREMSRKTR